MAKPRSPLFFIVHYITSHCTYCLPKAAFFTLTMDRRYLMLLEVLQYHVSAMETNGMGKDYIFIRYISDQITVLLKH